MPSGPPPSDEVICPEPIRVDWPWRERMLLKSADSLDEKIKRLEAQLREISGPDGHRIKRDLDNLPNVANATGRTT